MDSETLSARARRERLEPIIIDRFLARGQTLEEANAYLAQCVWNLEAALRRIFDRCR